MNEEKKKKKWTLTKKSLYYTLLEQIGKGAHGVVYKAKSKKDGKVYAMKITNLQKFKESTQKKLKREGEILASLKHKNIVKVHDSFIEQNKLYLILEFAGNRDLQNVVKRCRVMKKKIPERKVWKFLEGMLNGVSCLKRNRIVHRDIKPSNVFIMDDDTPKIGDFGVCCLMDEQPNSYIEGKTCGTPLFYAPEMFLKRKYSYKIDIWALGCVAYFICNQTVPFKGKDLRKLGYVIVNKKPEEIDTFYSSRLRAFITLMLDKRKKVRPTANDLLAILAKESNVSEWIENRVAYLQLLVKQRKGHSEKKSVLKNYSENEKNLKFEKSGNNTRDKEASYDSDTSKIKVNRIDMSKEDSLIKVVEEEKSGKKGSPESAKAARNKSGDTFGFLNSRIVGKINQNSKMQLLKLFNNKDRQRKFINLLERNTLSSVKKKRLTVKDIQITTKSKQSIPKVKIKEKKENVFSSKKQKKRGLMVSTKQKMLLLDQKYNQRERRIKSLESRSLGIRDKSKSYKPPSTLLQPSIATSNRRPMSSFSRRRRETDVLKKDARKLKSFLMKRDSIILNRHHNRRKGINSYAVHTKVSSNGTSERKKKMITAVYREDPWDVEHSELYIPKPRVKTAVFGRKVNNQSFGGGSSTLDGRNGGKKSSKRSFFRKLGSRGKNLRVKMRPSSALPKRLTIKDL